jgi:acetate kinase
MKRLILTINGGSSTIKFAAFRANGAPERILIGRIDRIGGPDPEMAFTDLVRGETQRPSVRALDHSGAALQLIEWIDRWAGAESFQAIGHRIVHAGLRPAASSDDAGTP